MANINEIKKTLERNTKIMVNTFFDNTSYDSRVEDYEDNRLLISIPTCRGIPMKVSKDTNLKISMVVSEGRLTFETKAQAMVKTHAYMLAVDIPTSLKHEQLRQFYRVSVYFSVDVFLGDINKLQSGNGKNSKFYKASMDNLSGGGCRITLAEDMNTGDRLVVNFATSPISGIRYVPSQILRAGCRPGSQKKSYSLVFTEIEEGDRDKIIRYVYKRQLDLRKMAK